MKYVTIDTPLKPKPVTDLHDITTFALNRAQSTLINLMADPQLWWFGPPAKKIEVIDLSETFNKGAEVIFAKHDDTVTSVGWKVIPVF